MNEQSLITSSDIPRLPAAGMPAVSSAEYSFRPQPGSVLDYWELLWRSKTLFAGCVMAGLVVALGILCSQSRVYRAHTTLEVQGMNRNFVDLKLSSPVSDPSEDALTDIQTQIKILESQTLIANALNKANIQSAADLNPQPGAIAHLAGVLNTEGADSEHETLPELAGKNLKVTVAGQTRIIEISFDAPRPELAARFANALTSEFIEQNTQARWQMNRQTSEWLGGQLTDLRNKLQDSESALEDYARKQSLIYTADQHTVSEEKLRQVQAELSRAQADRMDKQSRFEIARSATPETLPEVLNDNNLRALETSLTDLRRKEAEMEVTFTADYSQTKKVHAEILALEEAIRQKRTEIVNRITNELSASQRREQLLAAAYADQTLRVTNDSQKSIQYDVLKRDVDSNRQIYEAMLQRVKESTIAAAIRASNVRIIDPATPPHRPYKPNFPLGSAAGLLFGGMFGVVAIVLRARTDSSVQDPGEAQSLLGIRELGVIPRAQVAPSFVRVLTMTPETKLLEGSTERVIAPPDSLAADSFRAVLASIILGEPSERPHVLVITSANSGEGKTTAAANLAVALAKVNRKVLLIDGDIRSPRIHHVFGLKNTTGVTDLLNPAQGNEHLIDPIIHAVAPNLYVLTAGPAIEGGADLLFAASMADLIARFRKRFDMVIIDTPPMLAMPDARVLGRTADAVVLIARAGKTSRAAVQAAYRRLVEDQSKVLGVILNDWDAKASAYKHYSYYGGYRYAAAYHRASGEETES
jgi:polysaccharide biosynthesis transport protein